jgi:hypothetical protein
MNVENPLSYSFIFQDDIFLLNSDKQFFRDSPQKERELSVPETPKIAYNYLGGYKKKFLIVAHYPSVDFMDQTHFGALESTLKRLSYEMDDIALFNLAGNRDTEFEALTGFFAPQKLLILGKNALPGGVMPPYLNKPMALNGIPTLLTFSFDEMMSNNENKKAFWEQMKQF